MPDLFPSIPCPLTVPGCFWVYLLESADGSLNFGQTNNLRERFRKHRLRRGSKHTHDHGAPRLVNCEGPLKPGEAIIRKTQLKRWSRARQEALIRGDFRDCNALGRSQAATPHQI